MKKKVSFILIIFLSGFMLYSSDFSDLLDKAKKEYTNGNYTESKSLLESAKKIIDSKINNSPNDISESCNYCRKACDPSLGDFPDRDKYIEKSATRFKAFFKSDSNDFTVIKNMCLYNIYSDQFWIFADSDYNTVTVWVGNHHCKEYVMEKYEKNKNTKFTLYGTPFNHTHGHVLNIDRIE